MGDANEAIFSAIRHNRRESLVLALDSGLSIDTVDAHGNSLLIIAAQNNQPDLVELLARSQADLNKQNKAGNTALHYAFAFKFKAVQNILDGYGADDSIANSNGELPCQFTGKAAMIPRPPKT